MKKTFQLSLICVYACVFQSCSWRHVLSIENDTDQIWTVAYKVLDKRGVFQQEIYVYEDKEKEPLVLEFEDRQVYFELLPGQLARIGAGRNTTYRSYHQSTEYNSEIPWLSFINIDDLILSAEDVDRRRKGNDLKPWLKKDKRPLAKIKLSRVNQVKSVTP